MHNRIGGTGLARGILGQIRSAFEEVLPSTIDVEMLESRRHSWEDKVTTTEMAADASVATVFELLGVIGLTSGDCLTVIRWLKEGNTPTLDFSLTENWKQVGQRKVSTSSGESNVKIGSLAIGHSTVTTTDMYTFEVGVSYSIAINCISPGNVTTQSIVLVKKTTKDTVDSPNPATPDHASGVSGITHTESVSLAVLAAVLQLPSEDSVGGSAGTCTPLTGASRSAPSPSGAAPVVAFSVEGNYGDTPSATKGRNGGAAKVPYAARSTRTVDTALMNLSTWANGVTLRLVHARAIASRIPTTDAAIRGISGALWFGMYGGGIASSPSVDQVVAAAVAAAAASADATTPTDPLAADAVGYAAALAAYDSAIKAAAATHSITGVVALRGAGGDLRIHPGARDALAAAATATATGGGAGPCHPLASRGSVDVLRALLPYAVGVGTARARAARVLCESGDGPGVVRVGDGVQRGVGADGSTVSATVLSWEEAVVLGVASGLSSVWRTYTTVCNGVRAVAARQLRTAVGGMAAHPGALVEYIPLRAQQLFPQSVAGTCVFAVRREGHSADGDVAIRSAGAAVGRLTRDLGPRDVTLALSASAVLRARARVMVHGVVLPTSSDSEVPNLALTARARAMGGYVLVVGAIGACNALAATHAIYVRSRDEWEVPLRATVLPSAGAFRDAVSSLSPEMQAFASGIRRAQLSGSVVAVTILHVGPQAEAALGLPPGALTSDPALGERVAGLLAEYQVPPDVLLADPAAAGHGDAAGGASGHGVGGTAAAAARGDALLASVSRAAAAVEEMLRAARESEEADAAVRRRAARAAAKQERADARAARRNEQRRERELEYDGADLDLRVETKSKRMGGSSDGLFARAARTLFGGNVMSAAAADEGGAPRVYKKKMAKSRVADAPDGLYEAAAAPAAFLSKEINEAICDVAPTAATAAAMAVDVMPTATATDAAQPTDEHPMASDHVSDDVASVGAVLDNRLERLDDDARSLRGVILAPGDMWTLTRSIAGGAVRESLRVEAVHQRDHRARALALLDALTRGGALPFVPGGVDVHVVVPVAYSTLGDIISQVIDEDEDVLGGVDAALCLVASTVTCIPASQLLRQGVRAAVAQGLPQRAQGWLDDVPVAY